MLTVSEYSDKTGLNESTIRKQIRSGKLRATREVRNNKKVYVILVDNDDPNIRAIPEVEKQDIRAIPEAEIISEDKDYQMISIEKESFDSLIEKFEKLSNDRAHAIEESYKRLETEYHELRAELTKIREELYQEKIKAAQFEAELNILKLRDQEKFWNKTFKL